MAKIFKGDVNFGFVINQTGAQPLDSRSVVQNYTELLKSETFGTAIYNGMTVATIDEQKVYMLVDKTKATLDEGWKEIGSGSGSLAISAFTITAENKIAEATAENIGQIIYVTSGTESYPAGPYIVIADGEVSKLGTTTATGDIAGDVEALKTRVSTIENDYVTETELTEAINGIVIPEVPVKDVIYGEDSILDDNGVADLSDFAKTSELEAYVPTNGYVAYSTEEKAKLEKIEKGAEVNYVKSVGDNLSVDGDGKLTVDMSSKVDVDGYVAYSTEEKNKLADIEEGAEVNVIETIKVNEVELTVTDKAVNIDLSNYVTKDGNKVLSDENYTAEEKAKLEKIEKGAEVNYVKSVGDNLSVDGDGKLTVSIPEVEVPFQSVAENDKVLTLDGGVLSSTINLAIDKEADDNGKKYIRLTGKGGVELGAIDTTDFVVDGMLESVAEKEGNPTTLVFTWNSAAGITTTEIDFSKYVDTYAADGSTLVLGADNKTFSVKENVFDAYGAAAAAEKNAKDHADTELAKKADNATTLSGYGITDAYTKDEVGAELAKKVDNDTFKTVSGQVDTNKADIEALAGLIGNRADGDSETVFKKLADLASGKADKAATLAGYGITDAYTKEEADDLFLTGITVDTQLNSTSTNPVENKAVYAEIQAVRGEISNVVAGDLSSALKAYVKSADVNTINDVALYNEGGAVKVEIAAGNGATVTTDTTNKVITVDTKISEASYNIIEVKNDGLYAAISISGDDVEGEN